MAETVRKSPTTTNLAVTSKMTTTLNHAAIARDQTTSRQMATSAATTIIYYEPSHTAHSSMCQFHESNWRLSVSSILLV